MKSHAPWVFPSVAHTQTANAWTIFTSSSLPYGVLMSYTLLLLTFALVCRRDALGMYAFTTMSLCFLERTVRIVFWFCRCCHSSRCTVVKLIRKRRYAFLSRTWCWCRSHLWMQYVSMFALCSHGEKQFNTFALFIIMQFTICFERNILHGACDARLNIASYYILTHCKIFLISSFFFSLSPPLSPSLFYRRAHGKCAWTAEALSTALW